MFTRKSRVKRAKRKLLSALPPDASPEAIGAILRAFQEPGSTSSPGALEDDLGSPRASSEQSEGKSSAESAASTQESRRAKLKAAALEHLGSAERWEEIRDAAKWNGTELENEGEIIELLHQIDVQENPPPQGAVTRPSGEIVQKEEVGDYEMMYGILHGSLPEGKAKDHAT